MAPPKEGKSASFAQVLAKFGLRSGVVARIIAWAEGDGVWWFSSFIFHTVLVCRLGVYRQQSGREDRQRSAVV